jgi:hypothetical protein
MRLRDAPKIGLLAVLRGNANPLPDGDERAGSALALHDARLEPSGTAPLPSFETPRFARLLRMRSVIVARLFSLAREFLYRNAKLFCLHGGDDLRFFGVKLLPGRGNRGLVDQRLGAGNGG